ncbi:MAG TPA: SCO family protein [Polyangiaceae bacterium]|nr:SCO family protein [Polyangiaceae bacterium]
MSHPVLDRRALLGLAVALPFVGTLACRKRELPELGRVGAFTLTDQNGRSFGSDALQSKIWVAAFMFTRCPTICPRITSRMRDLQVKAKDRGVPVHLVSFSVDPEHDTPAVLRDYATRFRADLSSWSFVTGDLAVVRQAAVEGFKLALEGTADASKEHYGILHGSHLVLVDRDLVIRGYYRTDDEQELDRLLADAGALG